VDAVELASEPTLGALAAADAAVITAVTDSPARKPKATTV